MIQWQKLKILNCKGYRMNVTITSGNIEDHIEKIGITVAPAIEQPMEKNHFLNLYTALSEKYPNFYESMVQSLNAFQIRKKFIFPARGEIDAVTLAVPATGPVFSFPRKVGMLQEAETDLGDTEPIIMDCVRIFKEHFPHKKILRVGQINEYIFTIGTQLTGTQFISKVFTKIEMPPEGEIKLRINRPVDDYNRIIELSPIIKAEAMPPGQPPQIKAHGLKVKVDINNRDMGNDLDTDTIRAIIQVSKTFNETKLYEFLNGNLGEG